MRRSSLRLPGHADVMRSLCAAVLASGVMLFATGGVHAQNPPTAAAGSAATAPTTLAPPDDEPPPAGTAVGEEPPADEPAAEAPEASTEPASPPGRPTRARPLRDLSRRAREAQARKSAGGQEAGEQDDGSSPTGSDEGPSGAAMIDAPAAQPGDVPAKDRRYSFSIKDGTYAQLIEAFSRQTGMGVLGEAPDGKVSFVSTEELSYREALGRIRMLLFKYKPLEPYWLREQNGYLEILRVTDIYRFLEPWQMFRNVEEFRANAPPDDELALLVYTPKSGSVSDLEYIRDFMPDYVRIAPLEGMNALTVFALVRDINKYLEHIDFFTAGGVSDPRGTVKLPVEFVTASVAVEKIRQLMELDDTSGRSPSSRPGRRGGAGKDVLEPIPEPKTILLPDDEQRVILVKAMPNRIEEIKALLPYVDVDTAGELIEPVIIPVRNADASELAETIRLLISATATSTDGQPQPNAPRRPRLPRARRGTPTPTPAGATTMSAAEITLVALPATNEIAVIADEIGVARVRRLIERFDTPDQLGPLRYDLDHADAQIVADKLAKLLTSTGSPAQVSADDTVQAIWVSGTQREVRRIEELLKTVDVPGAVVELFVFRPRNQKPVFLANMLREYDGGVGDGKSVPIARARRVVRGRARPTNPTASKFTPDDEQGLLFVFCTQDEWAEYQPLLAKIDAEGGPPTDLIQLPVTYVDATDAAEQVTALLGDMPNVNMVPRSGTILVMGAGPTELQRIRDVLAQIDQQENLVERSFTIQHADPAELVKAIETLVGTSRPTTRRSRSQIRGKPEEAVVITTTQDDLTIIQVGRNLVVRTTREKLNRVVELIARLDVEQAQPQMRTYDFQHGTDLNAMSSTLYGVFGGSPAPRGGKGASSFPQFLPQSGSNTLIVYADELMFTRIEELIDVLRSEGIDNAMTQEFIAVRNADASELVEIIEPLLRFRVRQLVRQGELDEPFAVEEAAQPQQRRRGGTRRSSDGGSDGLYITADDRNHRIIIVAPQLVVEEAVRLVAEFDLPVESNEVFKTIHVTNAEPEKIVEAVREMMGAAPAATSGNRRSRRGGAQPVANNTPSTSEAVPFTILTAPGGGAVVLRGGAEDVAQAETWIAELDSNAMGRQFKVYEISSIDHLDTLAELIMTIVDTPGPNLPGARGPGGRAPGARSSSREEEEDLFSTKKTRIGRDIYLQTDEILGTMLVAAPPNKIGRIDELVAKFETEGPPPSPPMPTLLHPLKYASAFDASFNLESVLDVYWEPKNKLPQVDYLTFEDVLVVKYPDESRFPEIRELIEKYVDVVKPDDLKPVRRPVPLPDGIAARDAALWLKLNNPDIHIDVVGLTADEEAEDYGVERVQALKKKNGDGVSPCVLPGAFQRQVAELATLLLPLQQEEPDPEAEPESEPPLEEELQPGLLESQIAPMLSAAPPDAGNATQPPPSGSESPSESNESERERRRTRLRGLENESVQIFYDATTGALLFRGPAGLVTELEDSLKELKEELEKGEGLKPDIRVYRVRYVDVYTAAEILDEVLNASRREQQQLRQQQIQAMRQQQQAAQRAARQQQQQQQQQGRQPGGRTGDDGRPGFPNIPGMPPGAQPGQQPQEQLQMPPEILTGVRIVPNPRDRTLIIKANTGDYPTILELLATIDQPKPVESEYRTYQLKQLNATEVVEVLKEMLGLDTRRGTRRTATRSPAARGGQPSSGGPEPEDLPELVMQETSSGVGGLAVLPEEITLTANPISNTILAMAPAAALDYIGKLIEQMEGHEGPPRETRHFDLKHADVAETAEYLTNYYAEGRKIRTGKGQQGLSPSELNTPTFLPYSRLNKLTAQANAEQFAEIEELIAGLDVENATADFAYVNVSVDAKKVADLLTQIYGQPQQRGPRGGGPTSVVIPRFIGQEGDSLVFYSAPEHMREDILATVRRIEEQEAGTKKPRIIELAYAKPTDVASAIETAYGADTRRRTRNAPSGSFTISAHDATHRLFVLTNDDALFGEIESLAKTLDKPTDIGFEFKIYKLQHASARQVYTVLNKLVVDYIRRLPGGARGVEPFSVEVDDKANALVVLGSPTVFNFLDQNIGLVDIKANAPSPPGFFMVALKNADATEVAQNINRLWSGKNLAAGEEPPQAEANRALNMLIVRGTQAQIDEIKQQFVDKLEEHTAPHLKTEVITLAYAQPEAVAEAIKEIFDNRREALSKVRENVPPLENTVAITADVNTGQIIVQASDANLAFIKERIARLDREDVAAGTSTSIQVYSIKYADPGTVAQILERWARARATSGGRERRQAARDQVIALAEPGTQSVVVTASETNHEQVRELIERLDVEGAIDSRFEIIPLKYASAEEVEERLNAVYVQFRRRTRTGAAEVVIVANLRSNSIVVRGSQKDIDDVRELVAAFDTEQRMDTQRVTKAYALKYADPGSINGVILNMYRWDRRTPVSPTEQVTSAVDWGTRSVIVTASEENHLAIGTMIQQVDLETSFKKDVYTFPLKQANADDLAQSLGRVYSGRRATGRGDQPVQFAADAATNQLIVTATAAEMEELRTLIATLDVEPAVARQRQIRSFHLNYSEPWGVQNAINQMFRAVSGRNPQDQVTAVPEWGSNSVIVSASEKNMADVASLIEKLDSTESKQRRVEVIPVERADPASLTRALNDIYVSQQRGFFGTTPPITITEVSGSRSIMVKASDVDMAAIKETIALLDSEEGSSGGTIRVIPLLKSDATEVLNVMTEYLRKPGGGGGRRGGGGELVGDTRLSALTQSNALAVSGSETEVERIVGVIQQIDATGEMGRTPQLIRLEHANVADVVTTLQEVFTESRGRGGRGGTTQEPPVITANEALNMLVVRAGSADLTAIQEMVTALDTEDAAGAERVRILTVAPALNVTELAEKLETLFNTSLQQGPGSGTRSRGGRQERVSVSADTRTHSLLVSASPSVFKEIEATVRSLEEKGPQGGRSIRVLRPTNIKADEIQDLIERLREDSSGSSGSRTRGSRRRG